MPDLRASGQALTICEPIKTITDMPKMSKKKLAALLVKFRKDKKAEEDRLKSIADRLNLPAPSDASKIYLIQGQKHIDVDGLTLSERVHKQAKEQNPEGLNVTPHFPTVYRFTKPTIQDTPEEPKIVPPELEDF